MPPKYHHMTSRYARLSPEAIDHCVETVRDGNEALESHPFFDAIDAIVSARGIMEAERSASRPQTLRPCESFARISAPCHGRRQSSRPRLR